jgi:hypothetical protein
MTKLHGDNAARFSLLINDQFQGLGIGTPELVQKPDQFSEKRTGRLEALVSRKPRHAAFVQ